MIHSKRSFIFGASSALAVICKSFTSESQEYFAEKASKDADDWISQLLKRDRDVVGRLLISRFSDPIYYLLKPITWKPNFDQTNYKAVTVPAGFVTDLASIPRIFWTLLRPDGRYTYPAIVHDYLYWEQPCTKKEADSIFKFGMEDFDVEKSTVLAIHSAVQLAGQSAWDKNEQMKLSGEKRLLTKVPDDPRITWDDWKKDPSHFE